jgi:hypothetical protein
VSPHGDPVFDSLREEYSVDHRSRLSYETMIGV